MLRYVRAAFRFVTNGHYRSTWILRWRRPRNLFQLSNMTWTDRYPAVFRMAREKLGNAADVRLLSFGCATGEEVFTLRKYFPNAWIKGIDINPHNIAACQRRLAKNSDPKITFELADTVMSEPDGTYDAVFCMAVFRRGELADPLYSQCDRLIRFADFCGMVDEIARRLKPGGLLNIIHANFRFRDTPTADKFELVFRMNPAPGGKHFTPIFDRENRRTGDVNSDEVMFQKMPVTIRENSGK